MTLELLKSVLGWCTIINLGILYLWFGVFVFAHDRLFRLHGRWFKIPVEKFDEIHYGNMARFKIGIILLNLVPYFALRIAD
ncbi:MAG: hypothetical protein QOD99_2564 [Chthoniobacter sp.]|jgi:hypothetical protein|nr:hypothetical protein [Chthoniobacter sp.]